MEFTISRKMAFQPAASSVALESYSHSAAPRTLFLLPPKAGADGVGVQLCIANLLC